MAKSEVTFWLPAIKRIVGVPDTDADTPFCPPELKDQRAITFIPRIVDFPYIQDPDSDRPLRIVGAYKCRDAATCKLLMLARGGSGFLRVDTQEVINSGLLSAADFKELGITVQTAKEGPRAPAGKEPLPDFNQMKSNELIDWANDHGIVVASKIKGDRDKLVQFVSRRANEAR